MNYTKTKSSVIFELPLAGYLGKRDVYATKFIYTPEDYKNNNHPSGVYTDNHGWRTEAEGKKLGLFNKSIRYKSGTAYIASVQDKEEELFDGFNSNFEYITAENIEDNKPEAIKYLLSQDNKYTAAEIDLFSETLDDDIRRALSNAYDSNYQSEWLKEYFKMTQDKIVKQLADYLGNDFKMLDSLDDEEFKRTRTDQEFLRVKISKAKIKEYCLKEGATSGLEDYEKKQINLIDWFSENALDNIEAKEINTDYVDHYGSMGSFDDWLDHFKDYEETSAAIDKYREDELAKQNNLERASLNLKPQIEAIAEYIDKYISQEPVKTKIKRQINALKSVIKNAA